MLSMLLAGCAAQPNPRAPSGPGGPSAPVVPPGNASEMVVTAHRLASEAGLAMLRQGGAPIDAAVAAQAVLGLVEPQSSGPGGGSVLLTWQTSNGPAGGTMSVFDGTPRAGRHAAAGLNTDAAGKPLDPGAVMHGGGAVGVPGTLPALWAAHKAQGRLPWADLFAPAIKLADTGFPMPQALHDVLAAPEAATAYAGADWLFGAGHEVLAVGAQVRNPAYATTLRRVARLGPEGLYGEGALSDLLAALGRGPQPSLLTAEDFRDYRVTEPAALCMPWREWRLCTAPPPSFGGLLALQMLAMAGSGDLADAGFAHRFLDAGQLSQADRRRYAADPEAVPVPVRGLLDPAYLAARAAQITPDHAIAHPRPGEPPMDAESAMREDPGIPTTATSQIVVVDRAGNALSMTTSVTHVFGARVMVGGMALNNALTNFSPAPPSGVHYANEMAPNKRPATPMAPVAALDAAGRLVLLGGSGGGPGVPDFVAAALLDLLPGHRTPAEAVARPHISAADPDYVAVEAGTAAEQLMPDLRALGHQVRAEPLPSGSAFVVRTDRGWAGAADPRRDGVALGD